MENSLNRFLIAQQKDYDVALYEMKKGYKKSHWMWYIFPQIKGLGFSEMAHIYAINDLQEAIDYLKNDILRKRLLEITNALLEHTEKDIEDIMGYPDHLKLCSCMTLFEIAAKEMRKEKEYIVFTKVLEEFYDGERDKKTINLLKNMKG